MLQHGVPVLQLTQTIERSIATAYMVTGGMVVNPKPTMYDYVATHQKGLDLNTHKRQLN